MSTDRTEGMGNGSHSVLARPALFTLGGVVVGAVVALGTALALDWRSDPPVPAPGETTPVATGRRLGPRLELEERVFNLQNTTSPGAAYLKLQAVIEFQTSDPRWARVINGCVRSSPFSMPMVADAGALSFLQDLGAQNVEAAEDPCVAEEEELLDEFGVEIGSGRQLIEDAVTLIVTTKSSDWLATAEGKEELKQEIQRATEDILGDEFIVTRVLFTAFIMQ